MNAQPTLFGGSQPKPITVFNGPPLDYRLPPIATTADIDELLSRAAPVAIGVSGGKDSSATASVIRQYLDQIGHTGPRLLIHAQLGRAEWQQSGAICQQLADALGMELMVVARERGDMVDRWIQRYTDNTGRYANLKLVKALLPWSTAGMRFCTGEMKTAIICRALIQRFSGCSILNATGIRRQESANRLRKPVSSVNNALSGKRLATSGYNWNPIIEWREQDVWALHHQLGLPIHEAYSQYGMSRVSCAFCVLASIPDLTNAARCRQNQALFSELVDLEIRSTFSFTDSRWLADICPALLTASQEEGIGQAKRKATERRRAEREIPPRLLFEEGWPTHLPTYSEASVLASVRQTVSSLLGIPIQYSQPETIIERFLELMAEQAGRLQRKIPGLPLETPRRKKPVILELF